MAVILMAVAIPVADLTEDHPKVEADLMEAARPTAAHPTAEANLAVRPTAEVNLDLMEAARPTAEANLAARPTAEVNLDLMEAARPTAAHPTAEVNLELMEVAHQAEANLAVLPAVADHMAEAPNLEVHLIQAEAAALNLEVHLIQAEAAALNLEEVPMVAEAEEAPKEEVAEAEDLTHSMISLHSQWLDRLVLNQLKQHHQVQVQPLQMKFQSGRSL